MNEAARLIRENEVPLKEIAIFCGYRDYQQFAKVFKLHFGTPPSQYKTMRTGDNEADGNSDE